MSDLIQFLSDRDPSPWAELVGFVPDAVTREALADNHADLLLTSDSKTAVVEVTLWKVRSMPAGAAAPPAQRLITPD